MELPKPVITEEVFIPNPDRDLAIKVQSGSRVLSPKCYDATLQKILSTKPLHMKIDYFQRPFAWGKLQCRRLIDDLLHYKSEESSPFLGNITLATRKGIEGEKSVLDGQQRLTTFTLILAILRERFYRFSKTSAKLKEYGEDLSRECSQLLYEKIRIEVSDNYENRLVPKLEVSSSVKDLFVSFIQCEDPDAINEIKNYPCKNNFQKCICDAIMVLRTNLEERLADEFEAWKSFFSFIQNKPIFIVYEVE